MAAATEGDLVLEENVKPTHFTDAGHIGFLSPVEQKTFDELRASELERQKERLDYLEGLDKARSVKLHGREATPEELAANRVTREAEWPYELARFLRAHKWKLEETRKGYRAFIDWRRKEQIDSILDELPFNGLLLDRAVGNSASGCDKLGRPLYIEKTGAVQVDPLMCCFTDEDVLKSHLWQQENSCLRAQVSSKKHGKHVELFTQIVDLTGLSSSTQRAIKFTKALFAADAAYYPERLGDLYVIHAPFIFPVIWAIVKHWIDPVTRSKIHMVKGDPSAVLLAAVDKEQLPREFGGACMSCVNSPECAKRFTLQEFEELLPLKASDAELMAQMKKEVIKAGKNFKASITVAKAGECVEWVWQQEGSVKDDIDFSVTFTPADGSDVIQVCSAARIEHTAVFLPQCSWQAPAAGTLTVMWDNHFSWMATKTISYLLRPIGDQRRACLGDHKLAARAAANAAAGRAPASSRSPSPELGVAAAASVEPAASADGK